VDGGLRTAHRGRLGACSPRRAPLTHIEPLDVEDSEILTRDVYGDVVHGHLADRAPRRSVVRVPVDDEIRAVRADRTRKATGAEERPDRLRLADERVLDGRVMQEDEPLVAAGDLLETAFERLDLQRRLLVHVAKGGLSEIGDLRSGKPSDESLRAHDPDLGFADLEDRVAAVEDDDAAFFEHGLDLVAAARVMIVVPEDRNDRSRERGAGVGEDGGLLGQPVRGEIAGEEHEVALFRDRGKRSLEAFSERLDRVDVACGGDSHRRLHRTRSTRPRRSANAESGYQSRAMSSASRETVQILVDTMKRSAAALRKAEIEFMLGGGLAAWARGGPPTDHDVDFFVREEEADRGLAALVEAGLRAEHPPEEWLYKAHDGPVLVDLIFRPAGGPIGDEHFARATSMEVGSQTILVASIDDVLITKLLAISEQEPDFGPVLELARALREQIDWDFVRTRSGSSPFAQAFFTLAEGLGIVEPESSLAA